jgi:hypothetical protein
MKMYQDGGSVRKSNRRSGRNDFSYTESDITPGPNVNTRRDMERQNPMPEGFGEGYTPAPGEVPMTPRSRQDEPPMRATGPARRMKAGGAVTRGDGCAMKGKTKGRMV